MAVIQSPVDIMELSVIIPVTERYGDVETVYREYRAGVEECGLDYEIIYVLDGSYPEVLAKLKQLIAEGESLKVISLSKWFGESTALNVAFEHCRGDRVLTLPAYQQIDGARDPQANRLPG